MAETHFHTILVIGEEPEKTIAKYSSVTEVEKHLKIKRDDAPKLLNKHIKAIKSFLDSDKIKLTSRQKDYFKEAYLSLKDMDEFDYFLEITKGCTYDEETGDAYTTENPDAMYQMYYIGDKCPFAEPFILNDGTTSYSTKVQDIDWSKMHMSVAKMELCKRVWALIVDEDTPTNEREEELVKNWEKNKAYFSNFTDCDEYVKHTCSFWHYGVTDGKKFSEVDYTISDKEWVATFYDKFVKDLAPEILLTVCEVRKLDD